VREYVSPDARVGELHSPVSDVDVCESVPGLSQFTHVTVVPRLIDICCGTNAKFFMNTITVPTAGEEIGIRHSPAPVTGPVADWRSEKQLDSHRVANVTFTTIAAAASLREFMNAELTVPSRRWFPS